MYIIYMHTSLDSGKSYIGLTSRTMEIRWLEHLSNARNNVKYHFYNAIRLYGETAWNHTILHENINTLEEAKELEKYYIKKYDTFENGYNSTIGGEGYHGIHSEQTKELLRQITLSNKNIPEYTFYHEDKGIVVCTPNVLIREHGASNDIYKVIKHLKDSSKGWYLYRDDGSYPIKKKKYHFYNKQLNLKEYLTVMELSKKYNIANPNIYHMVNGRISEIKGWTLFKKEN